MDEILNNFRETQRIKGLQLAADSDVLDLAPIDDQHYIATFACKGLVRDASGEVRVHDQFGVGIRFADDYLRRVNPAEVLTWLGPNEIWHPNIGPPFVCLGTIVPGTPLVDLLHRCFEVITYQNVTMREDDALNHSACAWARRNRERIPVDSRPLKRRALQASIEVAQVSP